MSPWKALLLNAYYYGTTPYRWYFVRQAAAAGHVPVVVLFYHRIADRQPTSCTTSNREFRRQIGWLRRHCDLVSLAEAQRRLRAGVNHRPCVSITFDDGYAENCDQAIPLLIEERVPCTYFVTLENARHGNPFPHDAALGYRFAPNSLDQLRAMAAAGIEIGGHTYTHANLGQIHDRQRLAHEVVGAGHELADAIGQRVRYFAFPFGLLEDLNPAAFELAREAGYEAVCSAYGGYNWPGDDGFHLRRVHGDEQGVRVKSWVALDPRKVWADLRRLRAEPSWVGETARQTATAAT